MTILAAPKTDKSFWAILFLIWISWATLNFVSRQIIGLETVEHGIYSALAIIVVNSLVSLMFRELIHRFHWNNVRRLSSWVFILFFSSVFGFISAVLILSLLALYLIAYNYTSNFIFFWNQVYANWLIMWLMILLWAVIYIMTNYLKQLKVLEINKAEMALQLKEAQLNNLIGQLNPHFLFNGLNNIRGLMLENVVKSREMLTALSEILRYSLQSHIQTFQPLEVELDVIRSYIELSSIQYEERLIYIENIDEELVQQKIPPMLIQLLIENAIRHGIDRTENGGELSLSILKVNSDIQIKVTNPGTLEPEKQDSEIIKSTGLGLANVKQRLKLLYAGKASFQINQEKGIICCTILLPINGGEE